jgi:hypothetical protein
MSIVAIVGNVKDTLSRVINAVNLDEAKQYANQGLQTVQTYLNEGEKAIDPWLVRWANSKWSMPIAVGFGLALLVIGDVFQVASLAFGLLKLIF